MLGPFAPYGELTALQWRGDSNSFVDVFSSDFEEPGGLGKGALTGVVRRLKYPFASDDPDFALVNFGLTDDLQSARLVDIGECSAFVRYRDFLEAVDGPLEKAVCDKLNEFPVVDMDCTPGGRTELTPILHDPDLIGLSGFGNQDEFEIYRRFNTVCDGRLDIRFRGRFVSDGTGVKFEVGSSRYTNAISVQMDFQNDVCAGGRVGGGWMAAAFFIFGMPWLAPFTPPPLFTDCPIGDAGCAEQKVVDGVKFAIQEGSQGPLTHDLLNVLSINAPTTTIPCEREEVVYDADGVLVVEDSDWFCHDALTTALGAMGGQFPSEWTVNNTRCLEEPVGSDTWVCKVVPTVERFFQAADGFRAVLLTDPDPTHPVRTALGAFLPSACLRPDPPVMGFDTTGTIGTLRHPYDNFVDGPRHFGDGP